MYTLQSDQEKYLAESVACGHDVKALLAHPVYIDDPLVTVYGLGFRCDTCGWKFEKRIREIVALTTKSASVRDALREARESHSSFIYPPLSWFMDLGHFDPEASI